MNDETAEAAGGRGGGSLLKRLALIVEREGARALVFRVLHRLGIHRRLLVFAGPDPRRPDPPGIPLDLAVLTHDELDDYLEFRPDQSRPEVERRLSDGQIAFRARLDGSIVAAGWAAPGRIHIDHVDCWLRLRDDTVFIHDDFVTPALRGRDVVTALEDFRRAHVEKLGYPNLAAVLLVQNEAAYRHAWRRAAFASGVLWMWRLGPWRRHRLEIFPSPLGTMVTLADGPDDTSRDALLTGPPKAPEPQTPRLVRAEGDGRGTLESAFARGIPVKVDLSAMLPRELTTLDLERLRREFGDRPARTTLHASTVAYGTEVSVGELCGSSLEEDPAEAGPTAARAGGPLRGNAVLADLSEPLAHALESMPIFSGWKEMTGLLWINSLSGLHFDAWDSLLIQLTGRKRVVIYDCDATLGALAPRSIYPGHQAGGLLVGEASRDAHYYETWIEPGEAALIPAGALHSLDGPDSVSLSCFLRGGPKPRRQDLAFQYHLRESWPNAFARLVPRRLGVWLAIHAGIHFFETHAVSREGVPRRFRPTRPLAERAALSHGGSS